jgi:hypothetical protein
MSSNGSLTSLGESTVDPIEQDPLMIQQLSLSYDYLIYKIKEQIEGIAEKTKLSIGDTVEESSRQLVDIDGSIERLKRLMDESNNIEQEIVTIQQIGMIVHDFNQRLDDLEIYYSNR